MNLDLVIRKQYGYSDRELLVQLTENPDYQYFIDIPGFQSNLPYVPPLLVAFRKRLNDEIYGDYNYYRPCIYREKNMRNLIYHK